MTHGTPSVSYLVPSGPAAREARRPHVVRRRASKPARALRSLRRPSHRRCLWFWCARPGPAAAHRHRGRSLRRPSHRRRLWFWCAPPGPAAAHRHRGRSLRRPPHRRRLWFWCARPGPATASSISHAIPSDVFHGLKCDRWNSADSALVWGRAELELHAKLRCGVSLLWSSLLLRGIALLG